MLRGHGPGDAECGALAKITVLVSQRSEQRETARSNFTVQWWVVHLRVQDFMPNDEYELVYRGPPYAKVHELAYEPASRLAGFQPLSYKHWMLAVPDALRELQQSFGSYRQSKRLRLVRSARHSKFPECDTCQARRKAYLKVACNSRSDPEVVAAALQAMEVCA